MMSSRVQKHWASLADAGVDDVLRVAQPHVRAVGQAGNADQFLHGGGLGLHQHLPCTKPVPNSGMPSVPVWQRI